MESRSFYTAESIIFASGVEAADPTRSISAYTDSVGNVVVADGNHTAYRCFLEGVLPNFQVIGHIPRDVSLDHYYRPVSQLKVVDG